MSRYTDFSRDNDRYRRTYNTRVGDLDSKYHDSNRDSLDRRLEREPFTTKRLDNDLERKFLDTLDSSKMQASNKYDDVSTQARNIGDEYSRDYDSKIKDLENQTQNIGRGAAKEVDDRFAYKPANIRDDIQKDVDNISRDVDNSLRDVKKDATSTYDKYKEAANEKENQLKNESKNLERNLDRNIDNLKSDIKKEKDYFDDKYDDAKKNALNEYESAKDDVKDKYDGAMNNAKQKYDGALNKTQEEFDDAKNDAKRKYDDVKNNAQNQYDDVRNSTQEKYDDIKSDAQSKYDNAKNNAQNQYDDMKNSGRQQMDDIKDDGLEKFEDAKESLSDRRNEIENEVEKNLKNAGNFKDNVKENIDSKKSEIEENVNKVKNEIDSKDLSNKMALAQDSGAILKGAAAALNSQEPQASGLSNPVVPIECKDVALYAHNYVRKLHGVNPCKWDDKLAEKAEKWAVHLAKSDSGLSHSEPLDGFGENLYISKGSQSATGPHLAVLQWYKTISHYNFNDPKFNLSSGTFTQMIWDDSVKLGVGVAFREDTKNTYIVAQYSPPGNGRYSESFRQHVKKPLAGLPPKIPKSEDLLPSDAPLEGEKKPSNMSSLMDVLCYWCKSKEDKTVESWSGVQQQEDTQGKDGDILKSKAKQESKEANTKAQASN